MSSTQARSESTRDELYELAKQHDIAGRSEMTKAQLRDALADAMDGDGPGDHDIEPVILQAIGGVDLFVDDIVRYAEEAYERLRADHEAFIADHELGAFRMVDRRFT